MNNALGVAGIAIGFGSAAAGIVTLGVGLRSGRPQLLAIGRLYAWLALLGAVISFAIMERALITRDFSVEYVSQVGSHSTPALFNVAALWSALEGSMLLWVLILTGFTVLVAHRFRSRLGDPLVGWALLTMFVVCLFFFALLFGPAFPFGTVDPVPADGPGPNPLLQNHPLVAFHPPILYLGYVGFTVPFAFAIAALVTGRLGEGWLLEARRWTMIAWGCLTAGILLGAWWSYEVLGWGGYWAWDPVENASLLPWLTGTAYIHSVMVQERRGMLRVWNLSLLCATFSLTILGTFLTRSGVLDSVHAFASGAVGPWLLSFFGVIVAVTLGLIAWRGDRLRSPGTIDSPVSREGAFLANNVLFAGFAFVVLLGTVFPLVIEALRDERLAVGRPYFDRMTLPLGLALLFLMAIAPVLPWRKASGELLSQRLLWPAWIASGTVVVAVLLGARGLAPLVAFGLGGFAGGAALRQVVLATRRQGWRGLVGRTNGGMVVHLGVVLVAVALAASSSYSSETEVVMSPGDEVVVAGHRIEYLGMEEVQEPQRVTTQAGVRVDGRLHHPSIRQFRESGMQVGTPSVETGLTRDIYLTLVRLPGEGAAESAQGEAVIRVIVQPMIVWLWIGGGVMALGTALAVFPGRRRRDPIQPVSAAIPGIEPDRDGHGGNGFEGAAAEAGGRQDDVAPEGDEVPVSAAGEDGDAREDEEEVVLGKDEETVDSEKVSR